MFYTVAIYDVEIELQQTKTPSRLLSSRPGHSKDLLEHFKVCLDCETNSFQIDAQNYDGPYHYHALPVRCGQFLLLLTKWSRPVANAKVISVLPLLKEYTLDLLSHASVLTAYRPSLLHSARTGGLIKAFINVATEALYSLCRRPNCFGLSFVNLLLSGGEASKTRNKPSQYITQAKKGAKFGLCHGVFEIFYRISRVLCKI